MTKILVQGDLHGNTSALRRAFQFAQRNGCTFVLQVGDFGYGWDQTNHGDKMITASAKIVEEFDIPLFWLDGNHENFDRLEAAKAFGADEPVEMAPNVFYLPRGTVINLDWMGKNYRLLAIGGAYSVDKAYRIWGKSWWPQEEITADDLDKCYEAGKVDIVFSHDAPGSAFMAALMIAADGNSREMAHLAMKNDQRFPGAKPNRDALESVLQSAQPKLWIHGHYHSAYTADLPNGTHVIGLDMENEVDAFYVLNLEDWGS